MTDHDPTEAEHEHEEGEEKRGLPRWKKVLISGAALMLVVGLSLKAYGAITAEDEPAGGAATTQRTDGLTPDSLVVGGNPSIVGGGQTSSQQAEAEPDMAGTWSPFLVKGGFSFFLAFCVGYAIRTFLKISMLMIGALALGVFGLSYLGVIENVNWSVVEGWYDSFAAKVKEESGGFRTFVTGSLPSAGLATLGLVTGFKRN